MSSSLFGDTMVPNIESDSILLLGYSILHKEYRLTGFNHQKTLLKCPCFDFCTCCTHIWYAALNIPGVSWGMRE